MVVLNQVDTLSPDQAADCEADLRRLLDAEGLTETSVQVTSALTGAGLDELRLSLATAVATRRAAVDRITADIDALLDRFDVYSGDPVPGWLPPESVGARPTGFSAVNGTAAAAAAGAASESASASRPPWERPDGDGHPGNGAARDPAGTLAASDPAWQDTGAGGTGNGQQSGSADWQPWQATAAPLSEAAPLTTSRPPWEDATLDGRGAPALDPVSYVPVGPAATLTTAFAKAAGVTAVTETLNGVRERSAAGYIGWPLARLAGRLRGQPPARRATAADAGDTAQAQRSDIDNAITAFADEVGASLPEPWSRTVREAARSRADEAQAVLGTAVSGGLPPRDKVTGWWRLVALAQWLLMALSLVGVVWIVVILATHGGHKSSSLASDVSLAPWLGVMVAALLLLGWLIASWCQNMVVLAADREREQAVQAVMARIAGATSDLVLVPTGRELAEYERFRTELAAARRGAPALA
jgi:hypothetical protein